MKRISLLITSIFLISCISNLFASNNLQYIEYYKELFKKKKYHYKVVYHAVSELGDDSSFVLHFYKKNNKYKSASALIENFQFASMELTLDKENRRIYIDKIDKKLSKKIIKFSEDEKSILSQIDRISPQLKTDSIFKSNEITFVKFSDTSLTFNLMLMIDTKSDQLKRMNLAWNSLLEGIQVNYTITLEVEDDNHSLQDKTFSTKDIFSEKNGEIIPGEKYKNYQIIKKILTL